MVKKNPHAVALGRKGGRARTPAKLAAARRAAHFADRKPKFQVGDRARVNDQAPADYRRHEGFVTEAGPGKSEYRVEFDDTIQPTTGYLMSWWLERVR
jgi:hypothetical protein